jgi:hypothetical protein
MKADSTTVEGLANGTVKQKRSKAIDIQFYWIYNLVQQGRVQSSQLFHKTPFHQTPSKHAPQMLASKLQSSCSQSKLL